MSDHEPFDKAQRAMSSWHRNDVRSISGAGGTVSAVDWAVISRDPVDNVSCGLGDSSCASAHAGVLARSKRLDGTGAQHSLLRLQMRYGNQFVGRVLGRAASAGESGESMDTVERTIDTARGGGHSMDHGIRARMETAFGTDFSSVRVHTDARADGLSRALSARAFTTGHDVFFRQGEYSPGTSSGRELLAHELTHVVQQTGGGIHRKMTVSQPGDPHELEADRMAQAVMRQEQAQSIEDKDKPVATKLAADALQRQPEAPHAQDDEEKKKLLHAKPCAACAARAG